MNIQLEKDIYLTSDENCFQIKKLVGYDKKEKPNYKTLGYYSTLEQAINGYANNHMRMSEATSINQLRNELEALDNHIKNLFGGKYEKR